MKKFSVKDIMSKKPCSEYTEERVSELWKGKDSLSLKEILNLDIRIEDRSWILTKLVSTEVVVKWAQYCANEAQTHASGTHADDANARSAAARSAATDAYWATAASDASATAASDASTDAYWATATARHANADADTAAAYAAAAAAADADAPAAADATAAAYVAVAHVAQDRRRCWQEYWAGG